MANHTFAVPTDVEARWRPLTPSEATVAATLIDDASSMIRARWSDVDARLDNGSLLASELVRVVANMVKRAMMNGLTEGVEQQTQNAGPFALSQKFSNPNGNLYFTAEDVRLFEPEGYVRRAHVGWLA